MHFGIDELTGFVWKTEPPIFIGRHEQETTNTERNGDLYTVVVALQMIHSMISRITARKYI